MNREVEVDKSPLNIRKRIRKKLLQNCPHEGSKKIEAND